MAPAILAPKVTFILQVKVFFKPENRDYFLEQFKPVYDRLLAEPECAYFFIGERLDEPGVFRWTEGWTKDINWFMSVSYALANCERQ